MKAHRVIVDGGETTCRVCEGPAARYGLCEACLRRIPTKPRTLPDGSRITGPHPVTVEYARRAFLRKRAGRN